MDPEPLPKETEIVCHMGEYIIQPMPVKEDLPPARLDEIEVSIIEIKEPLY